VGGAIWMARVEYDAAIDRAMTMRASGCVLWRSPHLQVIRIAAQFSGRPRHTFSAIASGQAHGAAMRCHGNGEGNRTQQHQKMPPRFLQETGEVFGTGPRTCRTGGVSPARFIILLPARAHASLHPYLYGPAANLQHSKSLHFLRREQI